jgi:hypothetical protein
MWTTIAVGAAIGMIAHATVVPPLGDDSLPGGSPLGACRLDAFAVGLAVGLASTLPVTAQTVSPTIATGVLAACVAFATPHCSARGSARTMRQNALGIARSLVGWLAVGAGWVIGAAM